MSHWAKLYRTGSQAYEINMYSLSPLHFPLDRQLLTRYSGISLQSDTRRAEEGDATVLSVDSGLCTTIMCQLEHQTFLIIG